MVAAGVSAFCSLEAVSSSRFWPLFFCLVAVHRSRGVDLQGSDRVRPINQQAHSSVDTNTFTTPFRPYVPFSVETIPITNMSRKRTLSTPPAPNLRN